MLEREIEKYLCKKIKELGGLCEKFTSPSRRSVPDRIITLFDGHVLFVEIKSTTGTVSKAQANDHFKRFELGVTVYVLSSKDEVDQFIDYCKRTLLCY